MDALPHGRGLDPVASRSRIEDNVAPVADQRPALILLPGGRGRSRWFPNLPPRSDRAFRRARPRRRKPCPECHPPRCHDLAKAIFRVSARQASVPVSRHRGHGHAVKGPAGPSQVCLAEVPVWHTPETERAISLGFRHAEAALDAGRLIRPGPPREPRKCSSALRARSRGRRRPTRTSFSPN